MLLNKSSLWKLSCLQSMTSSFRFSWLLLKKKCQWKDDVSRKAWMTSWMTRCVRRISIQETAVRCQYVLSKLDMCCELCAASYDPVTCDTWHKPIIVKFLVNIFVACFVRRVVKNLSFTQNEHFVTSNYHIFEKVELTCQK